MAREKKTPKKEPKKRKRSKKKAPKKRVFAQRRTAEKMTWRLLVGDVRERLAQLKPESVQCVVTSPPYWGLRDYGTATWEGGDAECEHGTRSAGAATGNKGAVADIVYGDRAACWKCGAKRVDAQLGLECTPEEYAANMVEVFCAVRRVLRENGTLWLNLGDSYAGSRSGPEGDHVGLDGSRNNQRESRQAKRAMTVSRRRDNEPCPRSDVQIPGLKPKDLVGIPWRVAFALQADGWYLRSDIIWAKPNPMPESVTDRPTKSHEYLFLLTKSERYFYDAEAIKEPATYAGTTGCTSGPKNAARAAAVGRAPSGNEAAGAGRVMVADKRNRRTVWTIPTQPFPGAHFAVFPPALVEPCVKAGTSERGCCAECGAPWARKAERVDKGYDGSRYGERAVEATGGAKSGGTARSTLGSSGGRLTGRRETTGWAPTCDHDGDPVPCTVLDPFAGSGTTLLVANDHQRNAIGIELSPEYAAMARKRLQRHNPLFCQEVR